MTSSLPIFVALLLFVVVCEAKLSQHEKLVRLRTEMDAKGYHAVIIPSPDEHQSEYVATHDLRREWISGFTGSAGTAVVTKAEAALWTDSRYWVQAANELDDSIWKLMKSGDPETTPMNDWIISKLASGDKVGQSAKFVSIGVWEAREKAFKKKDIHLENTDPDLIDEIWPEDERAPKPATQIKIHDLKFAGESWEQKVARVQEKLGEASADMLVVSALDEVAWLFNLRASDIPYNPMVISYAIVNRDGNNHYFYIEPARVDQQLRDHLQGVEFRPYTSVISDITEFSQEGKRIWVPATSSYAIFTAVHDPSNHAILKESPVRSMKARKSQIEIENIRKCHLRDSAARIRHWYWLDGMLASNQQVTEITSAEELEKIQQKDPLFAMPSFDAISAVGPNAAIVHYSTFFGGTNLKLEKNKIYLLDAGAQYQDCTTDITRTHHFGNPTHKQRFAYTRVLQGSIDLANIVFPPGVYGRELDVEARQWLWRTGLDYGHGTGHGIGYFLSVHEDPPSISYGGGGSNDEFLEKGMIESDEPGYYESGEFGIRLETDLETVEADTPNHFRDRTYLKFEPLTFVPFDRNLIDECALTNSQVDWLNNYYKQIDEKVKPLLEASEEKSFLEKITEEFKYSHQLPYCSRYSPSTGNDDDDNSAHILQLSKPLVALMSIFFVIYFKLFA